MNLTTVGFIIVCLTVAVATGSDVSSQTSDEGAINILIDVGTSSDPEASSRNDDDITDYYNGEEFVYYDYSVDVDDNFAVASDITENIETIVKAPVKKRLVAVPVPTVEVQKGGNATVRRERDHSGQHHHHHDGDPSHHHTEEASNPLIGQAPPQTGWIPLNTLLTPEAPIKHSIASTPAPANYIYQSTPTPQLHLIGLKDPVYSCFISV